MYGDFYKNFGMVERVIRNNASCKIFVVAVYFEIEFILIFMYLLRLVDDVIRYNASCKSFGGIVDFALKLNLP